MPLEIEMKFENTTCATNNEEKSITKVKNLSIEDISIDYVG